MSEIERAIEYIESMFPIDEQEGEALSAALKALRAELSRQENAPLTWNERINQMTVEEKAYSFISGAIDNTLTDALLDSESIAESEQDVRCIQIERIIKFLNSPYTEGEKHEG